MEEQKKEEGFFNYLFNFDENNKALISNLFQYTFIAVPLVIIVLKLINHFSPHDDESKSSIEIISELILTLSGILLSIWFINKIVRFIPTFSKVAYPVFNEINFIIPFIILLLTMQTKIGLKVNILVERLVDLYDGKSSKKSKTNSNETYKSSQPISNSAMPPAMPSQIPPTVLNTPQISQPGTTSLDQLPNVNQPTQNNNNQANFNSFYQGAGASPSPEPMAANECLGGGMFGSSF